MLVNKGKGMVIRAHDEGVRAVGKAGASPKNRKLGRRRWVIIVLILRY